MAAAVGFCFMSDVAERFRKFGNLLIIFIFVFVRNKYGYFSQLMIKFPGSSVSLYVCSLGNISFISLYSTLASSA